MNTLNTAVNTSKHTVARREISQRFASLGLAAVMTMSILGGINLLAGEPAAHSLLAQTSPLMANASTPAPTSAPQV